MIKVSHLTKRYAGTTAVNDVSFEVKRGEIVGFLGPNGAGKTTTMRIMAGYLSPTAGDVLIAGRSVFPDSLEVRRRIGYLPEHCPLYGELRVDEYLRFRAGLKDVPARARRERLDRVKSQCGLEDVGRKMIGALSKGYRQRVGLADALIHEPELLLLDEPTIGLDPHQVRQVRSQIRRLASRHTILLSTHVLSEVEAVCDRVLIMDRGRIVAADTPEALHRGLNAEIHIMVECRCAPQAFRAAFEEQPFVQSVSVEDIEGWSCAGIHCLSDRDYRPDVFRIVQDRGWILRELRWARKSLEDVFVSLTLNEKETP